MCPRQKRFGNQVLGSPPSDGLCTPGFSNTVQQPNHQLLSAEAGQARANASWGQKENRQGGADSDADLVGPDS